MKVRSLKCVSFCPIQVFEDFRIKCYNKVIRNVSISRRLKDDWPIFFCYRYSFGSFYDFCCLCLRWQCFVYSARASEGQIPLEDWLRDSVFIFPSPSDLCGLVCILFWLEYLSACPVCLAGHSCLETKKIPLCRLL